MAINVLHHKNYRVIILLALLFCIFTHPVSAGTGSFVWSGTDTSDHSRAGLDVKFQSTFTINKIHVYDAGAVRYLDYVWFHTTNDQAFSGPSSTAQWCPVAYEISGVTVGTGTYGYLRNDDLGTVIIAAFMNDDFDIGAYSGAQTIDIVGSTIDLRFDAGSGYTYIFQSTHVDTSSTMAYLGYTNDPYIVQSYYGTQEFTTKSSYSFTNEYNYTATDSYLYFGLDRTPISQLMILINNTYLEPVNETSLQDEDLNVYWPDVVNNTWNVTATNAFSDSQTHEITIVYEAAPQDEDTILWGADSYVVDDTGSYSWSLSDSKWDTWLYSKKASIYRDETLVHEVSLPTQTGTFYYTFEEEGSFTVKLRHTSALLPHKTIDTDTVSVLPIGDSYIHVNSTIGVGEDFNISFSYGFTPYPYYDVVNGVKAKRYDEKSNQWLYEKMWGISDLFPITANTIYQVSGTHKIAFEGSYIFELYDFSRGIVATTPVITAVLSSNVPSLNISNSYINISKTNYVMGEIMDGFYGIDNDNFTYNNYLVVYNYQHGTTSMDFPLTEQASGFYGSLVQTDIHGDWLYESEIPVIPGNNKISIYAENSTTRFEVVHVNFTVSAYDEDGYGLQLSTYDACINEEVLISVISLSDANLTIFSPTGMPIKTYTLNGSTTIKYWFPTSGMYSLELYKSGEGISRATVTIYISDCADDGIIEPPSGEIDDMYLNMFNFMTLPIFWGMIIFVGFIGGLSMKTNRNGDHLVSGNGLAFIAFGLLNLLAFIGMLAPYTMYAIVSTWIFAGIFFGVGRYLARGE